MDSNEINNNESQEINTSNSSFSNKKNNGYNPNKPKNENKLEIPRRNGMLGVNNRPNNQEQNNNENADNNNNAKENTNNNQEENNSTEQKTNTKVKSKSSLLDKAKSANKFKNEVQENGIVDTAEDKIKTAIKRKIMLFIVANAGTILILFLLLMIPIFIIMGFFGDGSDSSSLYGSNYYSNYYSEPICDTDAAEQLAKILYSEVGGLDGEFFTKITTAAIIVNNAGGTTNDKIYNLTDNQYQGHSGYRDKSFESVVAASKQNEMLYIAETVLSGKYVLPKNIIYQASKYILDGDGVPVWTYYKNGSDEVYFGYVNGSLSSEDYAGNTLAEEAYKDVNTSVAYYKKLAKSLEQSSYSEYTKSNICKGKSNICYYNVDNKNVTNIYVRLLNCEGNTPVAGEELVEFEKYITGVVYQENGNGTMEALKTQAVAARSFAITRPSQMGGAAGITLKQEGDKWILSLRSCTNDQVYCDPDKGCWSNEGGGQTGSGVADKDATIHSGYDTSKKWTRPPLSKDSEIRKAVKETEGQVLVDSKGNIKATGYVSSVQNYWNTQAQNNNNDYFKILVNSYGAGVQIKSNCNNVIENGSDITSRMSREDKIVSWMTKIANDDSHGYCRWDYAECAAIGSDRTFSPDVDCSSFVYYALINAGGFTTEQLGNSPFSTGTMQNDLSKVGYKLHTLTSTSELKKGDIMWKLGHTEVYAGNGKTVGAHGCKGTTQSCSQKGDQDGTEVSVIPIASGWTHYFRYEG